jgi:hypothetical protein
MKIQVVKKASATRKPQNFCPWAIDDGAPPK